MDTRLTNWYDKHPALRVDLLASALVLPAFTIDPLYVGSGQPSDSWLSIYGYTYTLPRASFILTPLTGFSPSFSLAVTCADGVRRLIYANPAQVGVGLDLYANNKLSTTMILYPYVPQNNTGAGFASLTAYNIPVSLVEDISDFRVHDPILYAGTQTSDLV